MYSYEIDNVLKQYNFFIPSSKYMVIFDPAISTQISHIEYDSFNNEFNVDTYDNCNWKFKVYPDK